MIGKKYEFIIGCINKLEAEDGSVFDLGSRMLVGGKDAAILKMQ